MRIVAPLRLEARAVGGTSIGLRARRLPPDDQLVLAGVAGAVDPRLAPGDVVVADRILLPRLDDPGAPAAARAEPGGRDGTGAPDEPGGRDGTGGRRRTDVPGGVRAGDEVVLAGAAELARVLRIAGLTVHVGAVGGADRIVTGDARAAWADRGALAVDLESGVLARTGRLAAVVRAIVDTPAHPLVSPGTLPRGTRALRTLRRVAPVLSAWAAGQGEPDVRERQAAPVEITITLPGEVENS